MPANDPEVRSAVSKVRAVRRWSPNNTEALNAARRELRAAQAADYIKRLVDSAPPLTDEQRDRLALLLRGAA
jgi:hypothetical protein